MDLTYLIVRTLHVLAATFAVGIPVGLALVLRAGPRPDLIERLTRNAEYTQWTALAVLVATGIGNLAAFGDGLADPSTAWGRTFVLKLGAVLVLLAVSAVRTFVIAGQSMRAVEDRRLGAWYAATAAVGVIVVVLAEVLAHG